MNPLARLPWYSIALTVIVAVVANILLVMYSAAGSAAADREATAAQQGRLHQAALTASYFLGVTKQLARVTAAVIGPVRDRPQLERNLKQILRASDRKIVFGLAIGYAPYAFDSRLRSYGVYAFGGNEKNSTVRLLTGRAIKGYQYNHWYTLARDARGRIVYVVQYQRMGRIYIGATQGFYTGKTFAGAVAVASVQPALQALIRKSLLPSDRLTMIDTAGHVLWKISNPRLSAQHRALELPLRAAGWTLRLESDSPAAIAEQAQLRRTVGFLSAVLWLTAALFIVHLVRSQRQKLRSIELEIQRHALQNEVDSRALAEERLRRTAYYDSLTGLPNRVHVLECINDQLALLQRGAGRPFALCHIDLDRFSVINDSLGHPVGDKLVHMLAQRLAHAIPYGAQLGRIGGDEFIIRFDAPEGDVTARRVSDHLLEAIRAPFKLQEREIIVSASAGIALSAQRYRSAETMLRDADIAKYAAKNSGRDRYVVFDETMHKSAMARLSLEARIRRGISNDEFVPYYQPIISLSDGRVHSVEALARWRTDTGLVAADQFIPVAEHAGLLSDIDASLFNTACADAARLEITTPGIVFGANLSATCLNQSAVVKRILSALERNGVHPGRIRFELTETAIMERPAEALVKLQALRERGLQIVIDDFGTGYSSLSYVQRLPISGLKIDRSFILAMVQSTASEAIVRTIVAMAKVLGLSVTAEGVETHEQLGMLQAMGVDYAQGWYFAEALPYDALEGYIATRAMATAGVLHA